jgi:hypothetical protein
MGQKKNDDGTAEFTLEYYKYGSGSTTGEAVNSLV